MPSLNEFYIDKEKRELINMIYSAKYISEDQKKAMIAELSEDKIDEGVGYTPEVKKMEDRIKDMKLQIQDIKGEPGDDYDREDVQDLEDRIREKQKKIRDLVTAARAKDAKKKKMPTSQPLTGYR